MANEDQQAGLFDVEIDDAELEEQMRVFAETHEDTKRHGSAKRQIKALLKEREFKVGDRIRVGGYHFTWRRYQGGGIEIPEWSAHGATKIARIED